MQDFTMDNPGVDAMRMFRGTGFTIPDEIRAQVIEMDVMGYEIEDMVETGLPYDVVAQVLRDNKVEGRNPATAMKPMKFPQGKSMAPRYPASPPDDIGNSMSAEAKQKSDVMQSMSQAFAQRPQPVQDPRVMDVMNPRFNRY
jgi:hypothetical protein|tara:strand:- start:1456 stop:1881 length:426 start_codon:yes stop_codon:yes gene_type:complete